MSEFVGRYRLLKRLGAGGFGEVLLAEDPNIGRQVAIKVFRPRDENLVALATFSGDEGLRLLRARFLNEAKILASLESAQHVVNVLDYGELQDGAPYYVMPYLVHSLADELGKDVFDVVGVEQLEPEQRPRALPLERCLKVLEQLLRGLAAAHAKQLIHRDIKPGNIMFTDQDELRLVDFGIAKAPEEQFSTAASVALGSRNYMAPEQRESAKHVDARADVYSVGRLAYRMLTGRLPVGRFADPEVAVPALGKALNQLILEALAENREERPADAQTMLDRFLAARPEAGDESKIDPEASATWSAKGEAGIRDELRPLKDRAIALLAEHGEIAGTDRDGLLAMGAVADLDAEGVDTLIDELWREDKTLSAKSKLAKLVADRVRHQKGPLDTATLGAYQAAAEAVGWDQLKLLELMQRAVDRLPPAPEPEGSPAAPSSEPGSGAAPAPEVPPGRGAPGWAIAAAVVMGIGLVVWQVLPSIGQPSGEVADTTTSSTSSAGSSAAPAAAKEDPSVRHQVLKVQDYLNRLGYRVPETGELDLRTTEAIRAFEQSMKMVVTGAADDLLAQSLVEEFDRRDRAAWEKATKTDTEAAFRAYQQDYPMGAFVGDVEFSVEASNQRKADRERRARDARIAEQKKQEEAARLAEEARQAEAARQAELARQEQLRQEEQRRAQVALALQQCDTKCSRNRRNCEADNNPRDCRIEQCQGGYGGDPLMQLGGLLQCKQDAERDYRDCQREAREYLAECPIIEQDCKQDCRFKHTL